VADTNRNRNKNKPDEYVMAQYVMAVLYPTYENVKSAPRSISYNPDSVSEDSIQDFIDRMKQSNAKYRFMSMLLAGDYSFLNSGSTKN
jgi:hypothetical protein